VRLCSEHRQMQDASGCSSTVLAGQQADLRHDLLARCLVEEARADGPARTSTARRHRGRSNLGGSRRGNTKERTLPAPLQEPDTKEVLGWAAAIHGAQVHLQPHAFLGAARSGHPAGNLKSCGRTPRSTAKGKGDGRCGLIRRVRNVRPAVQHPCRGCRRGEGLWSIGSQRAISRLCEEKQLTSFEMDWARRISARPKPSGRNWKPAADGGDLPDGLRQDDTTLACRVVSAEMKRGRTPLSAANSSRLPADQGPIG